MRQLARQLLALAPEDRRQLQQWLRRGAPPVEPGARPLDFHQLLLWLLDHRGQAQAPSLVALGFGSSPVSPRWLMRAAAEATERFEELGVIVDTDGDEPRLWPAGPAQIEELDYRRLAPTRALADLVRRLREWRRLPLPGSADPPWRGLVVRRAEAEDLLLLVAHPIIADSWALEHLGRWLLQRCRRRAPGRGLPGLATRQQREWLVGPEASRRFSYWRQQLAGAPQDIGFPADRPAATPRSLHRAGVWKIADGDTAARLRRLAGEDQDSGSVLASALVFALLFRLSGHGDLCITRPEPRRDDLARRGGLGVLRCRIGATTTFLELTARVREAVRDARDHHGIPYELLVDLLADSGTKEPPWSRVVVCSGSPLQGVGSGAAGPLENLCWDRAFDGAELVVVLEEREVAIWATVRYSPEIFTATTAHRLSRTLERLASRVADGPGRPLASLDVLSPAERSQLTHQWNDTAGPPTPDQSLVDLFETQAAKTPDAVAAVHGSEQITYRQLDRLSAEWARRLAERGIGPEDVVGLCCHRGLGLLLGVLGILRAGAAYLPLDLRLPRDRLEFMLADAAVRVVLTEEDLQGHLPAAGIELWALEWPEARPFAMAGQPRPLRSHLAYLLYTSGSTGIPKAVALEHRGAVVLIEWARELFAPADLERVLFCSSLGFDLSVFEIFLPLASGGTVVVAETPLSLADVSESAGLQRVTFLNTVPTAMTELVRAGALPPGVRILCLAGEPLTTGLVEQILGVAATVRVLNLFGATEDSTHSTVARIDGESAGVRPHVGRPIRDTRIYLVDRLGRLAPIGATGEICLAGEGLARAYHGRPALTAAAFRPNPYSRIPGDRLYFTGDLGRREPDGRLDCLGRRDRQAKLRGFRIELGEIEAVLSAEAGVREAAVLLRRPERGDPALVAYLVTEPDFLPSVAELRRRVAVRLPEYMVPSFFVTLVGFPRTASGKVDRKALPGLADPLAPVAADTAPRTPIEETLAGLWNELLGRPVPSMQASFFELGGHSVLAARLVARIRDLYGVALEVPDIYRSPSIEQLAVLIEETIASRRQLHLPPLEATGRDGLLEISAAQRRAWHLECFPGGRGSQNLLAATHLQGPMDRGVFSAAIDAVAARHETLRTRFEGWGEVTGQRIEARVDAVIPRIDLVALPVVRRWQEVSRLALVARGWPFDPIRAPLFRSWLVEIDDEDNVLIAVLHASIGDQASLGIFLRDLSRYYFHRLDGCPLPEVMPLQHVDFVSWQNRWLRSAAVAEAEGYWRGVLADPPPALGWSRSRPRSSLPPFAAGAIDFELPAALTTSLESLGKQLQVSLFTLLLATFELLLGGSGHQREVLVGIPSTGRGGRLETEIMIGCFAQVLVLRTRFGAEQTLDELLARVRESIRQAHTYGELPFDWLAENSGRDEAWPVRAVFSFDIRHPPPPAALRVHPLEIFGGTSNVDLSLAMVRREGGLGGRWIFRHRVLDGDRLRDLDRRFAALLERIATDPIRRLESLDVVE